MVWTKHTHTKKSDKDVVPIGPQQSTVKQENKYVCNYASDAYVNNKAANTVRPGEKKTQKQVINCRGSQAQFASLRRLVSRTHDTAGGDSAARFLRQARSETDLTAMRLGTVVVTDCATTTHRPRDGEREQMFNQPVRGRVSPKSDNDGSGETMDKLQSLRVGGRDKLLLGT